MENRKLIRIFHRNFPCFECGHGSNWINNRVIIVIIIFWLLHNFFHNMNSHSKSSNVGKSRTSNLSFSLGPLFVLPLNQHHFIPFRLERWFFLHFILKYNIQVGN